MYGQVEIAYSKTNALPHQRAAQTDPLKQSPCLTCRRYIPGITITSDCRERNSDCPLGSTHQSISCARPSGKPMEMDLENSKECLICGETFYKPVPLSMPDWLRRRACSVKCAAILRQREMSAKHKVRNKAIRKAKKDGVSTPDIAKEHKLSEGRIRHILAKR